MSATPVQVTFSKPQLPFNAGESGWFDPVTAAGLVASGVATLVVGGPSYTPPAAIVVCAVNIGIAGVVS